MPLQLHSTITSDATLEIMLAEVVDKVLTVIFFETMIQNSEKFRINNAAIKDCQIDCCVNFGGPDFFNTLG